MVAEAACTILSRAEHLLTQDREILHAIYGEGKTAVELARLLSHPIRPLRRRIRALTRRVNSPLYLFVLRARHEWNATLARVATAIFLEGRSLKVAARTLNVSYFTVRRQRDAVTAMLAAHLTAHTLARKIAIRATREASAARRQAIAISVTSAATRRASGSRADAARAAALLSTPSSLKAAS